MAVLSTIGRQFWLAPLIRIEGKPHQGFQEWILRTDYSVNKKPAKKSIELDLWDFSSVALATACDISRLSSAAFESLEGIRTHPKKPLASGWILIRAYYGAYFAANALMRCFGFVCTNFDIAHINAIRETARLFGYPSDSDPKRSPQPGVYFAEIGCSATSVSLSPITASSGGAHAKFWSGFMMFLDRLSNKIKASAVLIATDRAQALADIAQLKATLSRPGFANGSWLSHVRNGINYRHEHGVWFPYDGCASQAKKLVDILDAGWKSAPEFSVLVDARDDLESFSVSCAFLVALCRDTIAQIATAKSGKQFLKGGPLHFLNDSGVAA